VLASVIVAARFLQFLSLSVLFGSSLFFLYGLEGVPASHPARRWSWTHVCLLSASLSAIVATAGWLMAETVLLTDNPANAVNLPVLWFMLSETGFGQVYLFRLCLLVLSATALLLLSQSRVLWIAQSVLGGVLVVSLARTGHGIIDQGVSGILHSGADALHALAAAIWIGALVPLRILIVDSLRPRSASMAKIVSTGLERFSGIGPAVVSILVLTGAINSWFLIGLANWQALFSMAYGIVLLVKLILFGGMLALATANRFVLMPHLYADLENAMLMGPALRSLRASVLAETALAIFVLVTVSILGTLEPPISEGSATAMARRSEIVQ
jgi:putative copper resistance protein D